jgi:hypothetical protein
MQLPASPPGVWIMPFVSLQRVVTEVLRIGKENPHLGHMKIINKVKVLHYSKGRLQCIPFVNMVVVSV